MRDAARASPLAADAVSAVDFVCIAVLTGVLVGVSTRVARGVAWLMPATTGATSRSKSRTGACERPTATIADGWNPYMYTADRCRDSFNKVKEYAEEAGRQLPKDYVFACFIYTALFDDEKEARQWGVKELSYRYDVTEAPAPMVLAKGLDRIALQIREIAIENDVPIHENPPLAQALYKQVEIGETIPEEMYQAVAAILAKLAKFKNRRA